MNQHEHRRVWVVTQPFHLRRALFWFRRAGFEPLGWHIDESVQYREPWRGLKWVVREYGAWVRLARSIALSHHERFDGSGYPYGLSGEQIPIEGRILTLADQYDALRNTRCYKPAFDHDTTCRILIDGDDRTRPQHFDPRVLAAFKELHGRFAEVFAEGK